MPRCGLVEKNKPACEHDLGEDGLCPVHCRAHTPKGPCKRHHAKGRRRCDRHGGKSKKGIDHPNYKHGAYVARERIKAALVTDEMREAFEESELYPEKLSLRPSINLLDMRVALLLRRIQRGEGPAQWGLAQEAFEEFAEAQASKNRDRALDALGRLASIIRRGVSDERDWGKVEELEFQRRPKLVEAEDRLQYFRAEMVHIVLVDRVLQLAAESVKNRVKDTATIEEIESDFARIIGDAVSSLSPGRRLPGPRR